MNIDDLKTEDITTPPIEQIFHAIFEHQTQLEIKYGPIEQRNGFYHPDFNNFPHIDDAKFQHWIKEMFWRVTEEVAEAMEVESIAIVNWFKNWQDNADVRHFYEELADALHFLTAVTIAVGIPSDRIWSLWTVGQEWPTTETNLRLNVAYFVCELGLAANCLKNKPWKSTHMPTDEAKFVSKLVAAWTSFLQIWRNLGWSLESIYCLYMKKNLVNQFRQRSNY